MAPRHCAFLRAQVDFDAPLGYKEPERQAQHEESAVSRPPHIPPELCVPTAGFCLCWCRCSCVLPAQPTPWPRVSWLFGAGRGAVEGPGEGWGPTEKLVPFPCPSRKAKLNTVATPGSWASV